jgi:hypothetical protein
MVQPNFSQLHRLAKQPIQESLYLAIIAILNYLFFETLIIMLLP